MTRADLASEQIIGRVERAGYGVAKGEADLIIRRMGDANDASRLEKALGKLEGVLEVQVNLAGERARHALYSHHDQPVRNPPGRCRAGFEAVEIGGQAEDAEAKARAGRDCPPAPPADRRLDLHHPAVLAGDGRDLGLLPMA